MASPSIAQPAGSPRPTRVSDSSIYDEDMLRQLAPPVNRNMRILDRDFFKKTVKMSAVRILEPKMTSKIKKTCCEDLAVLPGLIPTLLHDPDPARNTKIALLKFHIKHDNPATLSSAAQEFVRSKILELIPYDLNLTYDNWGYGEILRAILPEDMLGEIPSGYAAAGHVAHVNIRAQYNPYKHLIAQVIVDKRENITTVVNKLEDVGTTSEFRTFPMEILAGDPNTEVEVSHGDCIFKFDFAKVYWNTRLVHEHERVYKLFRPGEAIADVMAGVGPFAIPAGKRKVFVWANDLNPESYAALALNITRNKVGHVISAHNEDGRQFIRDSIMNLYRLSQDPKNNIVLEPYTPRILHKVASAKRKGEVFEPEPQIRIHVPPVFARFIMNLPASAISFLDAFIGAYLPLWDAFERNRDLKLPIIHVYAFHHHDVDVEDTDEKMEEAAHQDITRRISEAIKFPIKRRDITLVNVRMVAPNKTYYCAEFRLPVEVAFSKNTMVDKNREQEMWEKATHMKMERQGSLLADY